MYSRARASAIVLRQSVILGLHRSCWQCPFPFLSTRFGNRREAECFGVFGYVRAWF